MAESIPDVLTFFLSLGYETARPSNEAYIVKRRVSWRWAA